MSLIVAGTVAAYAAWRGKKGPRTGPSMHTHGTDILGAELPPAPAAPAASRPAPVEVTNRNMYVTQVAAGVTVLALWSIINTLRKR